MGILKIEPVTRKGMKLIVSLYGLSETGKTLSALKLACGIEPNPAKRMLLDTEGGERGRAYMDDIPGGYLYAKLTPPFTPQRYTEAMDEIEAAGVNVLVIDSGSHVWFAEGGVLDMADKSTNKNDFGKWMEPKKHLRRMINRILSSDMHIIICARAKQTMIEEFVNGKKKMVEGPIVPIQDKNLRFDMTVVARMLGDGFFTTDRKEGGECPGALRSIFNGGTQMNEDMGKKIVAWIGETDAKTPEHRRIELEATQAAEGGADSFRDFWKALAKDKRALIVDNLDNYQSIAKETDREKEEQAARMRDAEVDLEHPFGEASPSEVPPQEIPF